MYLIAPLADMVTEEDIASNIRLESGLKIWQALWQVWHLRLKEVRSIFTYFLGIIIFKAIFSSVPTARRLVLHSSSEATTRRTATSDIPSTTDGHVNSSKSRDLPRLVRLQL